jgi:cation diffusion facilitator family transporter
MLIITLVVCIMIGGFFFIELIWGLTGGSLALVADAMHMLSDTIALVVGFYALRVTKRRKTDQHTYGWTRMEVVAGLCNGMFLIGITFAICLESIERFLEPQSM